MVQDAADYPHSSHLCYLEKEQKDWLYRDAVYRQFAKTKKTAIRKYTAFIDEREEDAAFFRKGEDQPDIIGDDGFAEAVMRRTEEKIRIEVSLEDILQIVGETFQVTPAILPNSWQTKKKCASASFCRFILRRVFRVFVSKHCAII